MNQESPDWVELLQPLAMGLVILIALSSVFISLFVNGPVRARLLSHPVYIIPWILLVLLLLIFIWHLDPAVKRKGSFLFLHFALVFLIFAFMMERLTSRFRVLTLAPGETVVMPQIQKGLGAPISAGRLILDEMEVLSNGNGSARVQSHLRITNKTEGEWSHILAVNSPLKWKGLKIYQDGFSARVTAIEYVFQGQFTHWQTGEKIRHKVEEDYSLILVPGVSEDVETQYRWLIIDDRGKELKSGVVTAGELEQGHPLSERWGLKILREETVPVNRIKVWYKPFLILPLTGALLFLLALIMRFLPVKLN